MGSKLGSYIPLPFLQHCPRFFTTLNKNALLVLPSAICRIEQKWMCQSHGILQLPHSFFRTVVLPFHLHLSYFSVPEHCDLPSEDAHRLDLEISLWFHLHHIPIYYMVRIMYIFLKKRNMKNIMSSNTSTKCKSICNRPYFFKHLKWLTISR